MGGRGSFLNFDF